MPSADIFSPILARIREFREPSGALAAAVTYGIGTLLGTAVA